MKKVFKMSLKVLSVILTVLMVLQIAPMQLIANAYTEAMAIKNMPREDVTTFASDEDFSSDILYEVEEKRDEFTKVYKKNDGSYTAMVSSEPLHFIQDGKWTDIDNTLVSSVENGKSVFTNTNSMFDIMFPDVLSENSGIEIKNDEYSLSFSLQDIETSQVEITENTNNSANANQNNPQIKEQLKTQSDSALYENVMDGTDIEYSISSNKIKENIIINQPSAIKEHYSFTLSAEGLTGVIEDDNSVSFLNADGEKIFYIPAPFMKDASNVTSLNIGIDLTNNGNGEYVLTYSPDFEWLNDELRTFPIIIDPIISVANSTWIEDVSVTSENPNDNYYTDSATITTNGLTYDEDTNEVVDMNVSAETYVAFDFEKIDLLTEGVTPIDAQLVFAGAATNVAAYEIISDFDATTVTYNTKPQVDTTVIDYYTGKESFDEFELIHFNITDILYDWISGSKVNNGIAILGYDNTLPGIGLFLETALFIEYVETSGYDDRFDHHTQDIGRAGTSYINDFTQKLTLIRDDLAISGNIMPVSISFVYNSAFTTMVDKFSKLYELEDGRARNIPQVYGNNWITNYNRGIFINEYVSEFVPTISYFTETGTIINFVEEEQEDGSKVYVEEKTDVFGDSGYSIIYDSATTFNSRNVKIKNPNGEIEEFDSAGRLIKIYKEKYPSQSINITYVSNLSSDTNIYAIDYITDGVGRKYDFSYNSNTGLLTRIRTFKADGDPIHAGSTDYIYLDVDYYYSDNGNLTKVVYPDLNVAKYEYDSNNRVTSATSLNAYKLTYSYDNFNRVRSISEFSQDTGLLSGYVAGNTITITPDGPKQVTFSDLNGAVETKQFDRYGRTTLVTDEKGNYVDSSLGSYRTMSKNLLANQSFENGLDGWTKGTTKTPTISETYSHSGEKAVKFASDTAGNNYIYQSIPVTETGIYTFSVYVKAVNEFSSDEKLSLLCGALDANGEFIVTDYRTVAAVTTDFNRYSVSVDIPEDAAYIVGGFGFLNSYGEFYVDSAQLEKGSGFGLYNQLNNSSFADISEDVLTGWTSNSNYTLGAETVNTLQCNTVNFPASKNANYTLSQTIQIDGKEGDIVTFGGWLKADVVSNDTDRMLAQLYSDITDFRNDRFAGFTLTYSYISTDENGQQVLTTETIKKSVKDFIEDWQFVEEYVILKGNTNEFEVSFEYINHPAEASATMPFFTIEPGFVETEEIESGETVEALNFETNANASVDLCICGENCEYGDGCPCDCTSEALCDCAECKGCTCSDCTNLECTCACPNEESCTCDSCMKMFDIQYDEYGNLLSIKIAGKYITSENLTEYLSMFIARSYSINGNYLESSTDENGQKTLYEYNDDNGVLKSVTDPRGNVTNYTYDAIGALTMVETPVSNLAKEGILGLIQPDSLDTVYGYKDDKLTSISHNDFTYYIKYDQWGNVSEVYVSGLNALTDTTLAEYEYDTGEDRNLLKGITYGNGDTVKYKYDSYDRVIGISYDNGETNRFRYGYDSLGNVTYIIDSGTGKTTFFNEDSTEVYLGDSLYYYAGYDEDGNLVEYEGGYFTYTTKELESVTDADSGYTTTNTQIGDEDSQINLLKTTDKFSRTQQKAIQLRDLRSNTTADFASVVTDYTYGVYTDNENQTFAGGQVETISSYITYGENMEEDNIIKDYVFSYEYDENGNIIREYTGTTKNDENLRYRYTYDEANQLTRVDDNVQSKTYVYQYDKGGNRVSQKIYDYTLSDSLGTVKQEIVSEYENLVWDDLLTSYNGKEIRYDNAGNPTSYDGQTYVWDGKQLKEIIAQDGSKTVFDYDANGLRTRKIQYNAEGDINYLVDYVWSDGKIISQYLTLAATSTAPDGTTNSFAIGPLPSKVIYDDNGIPQGFTFGNICCGFVRNLQGDAIALVDYDGNVIMEYSYDPWGNIEYHLAEGITEQEAIIVTALCPLTYRGYNYDFTTGLYYLQSRYYNPEWGRFLNCDDTAILLSTQGETHNSNLFAYCANNPVNRVDYTGYDSEDLDANDAFVYGLYAWAFLSLEMEERGRSELLSYEYISKVYVNEYNIITTYLQFYNQEKSITHWYSVSVSIGLKKDWWEYRANLANSSSAIGIAVASIGLGIIGLGPKALGAITFLVGTGLTIASTISSYSKSQENEEITQVFYRAKENKNDDNELAARISVTAYAKETNATNSSGVIVPTSELSYNTVLDNYCSYWFTPKFKRIIWKDGEIIYEKDFI